VEHRRLDQLDSYYRGKHKILQRQVAGLGLPNNRLVVNHAKYISGIVVGYVMGKPVKYTGEQIKDILNTYRDNDIISHDAELGKDLSVFGIALELHYMSSSDPPMPQSSVIDPGQVFLVVDDTVEYKSLFAVHYYPKYDMHNSQEGWHVWIYTASNITQYHSANLGKNDFVLVDQQEHFFGAVPVIEFWNNEEQQGDFEQQLTLIDAYNLLQSDRVNDKEQLVDSILKVVGMSLGDTLDDSIKSIQLLKQFKVLEMPNPDSDASWLTKSLNEDQVELLRKSLKNDIYESALVPCLTDEHFASNASGVAMEYKLFGLEQLAQVKERYFVQGLRERLKLYANILRVKGKAVDVSDVEITMTRNLPTNLLEIAQLISILDGKVSNGTLISLLPFVSDVAAEQERLAEQLKESMSRQQAAFGFPVTPGIDDDDDATGQDE
jgi:SPP1 family phage portal protein